MLYECSLCGLCVLSCCIWVLIVIALFVSGNSPLSGRLTRSASTTSASTLRGLLGVGGIPSQVMDRRQFINVSPPHDTSLSPKSIEYILHALSSFNCHPDGVRKGMEESNSRTITCNDGGALMFFPPLSISLGLLPCAPTAASVATASSALSLCPWHSWLLGQFAASSVRICPAHGSSSSRSQGSDLSLIHI